MSINKQLKSLVLSMLGDGDSLQRGAIALTKLAAGMPYADFNNACAVIIGEKYGVEPHESRKGGLTFTKNSAEEQRLKRFRRLHPDMAKAFKTEGQHAEETEVEIPAELIAAAQRLAKLAEKYEGARKLASRALATVFAK